MSSSDEAAAAAAESCTGDDDDDDGGGGGSDCSSDCEYKRRHMFDEPCESPHYCTSESELEDDAWTAEDIMGELQLDERTHFRFIVNEGELRQLEELK